MPDEDPKVSAEVSGGTAQGVIGAGEVHVGRLVINNYAQPSPVAEETTPEEPGALPENPYKGLSHFGPDDADLLFGRQKAIDKLVKAVEARSFNAVLGPSGCGKSSVLLAGVAPTLHKTGQWAFAYFRISDSLEKDPFLALAQAVLPLYLPDLDETDRLVQRRKLGAALRQGDLPVTDILDAIRRNRPEGRVLLIADQFEELYTSNIDADLQARFMDLLIEASRVAAAASPPVFSLAVTLRADFLGLASLHRPFADAIDESVHILGPMEPDELSQAIVEPARLRGVVFEKGLVETILADVGREPGNLPLLEFALTQMWGRQQDRRLTLASYDGVGRVTGALTKHADQVFEDLEAADQARARRIFTQLVRLGAGTEDTRRVARRDELSDTIWPLVQRLAGPDCRLVVTNATVDEGETAEVVHEALIKYWGTLRDWVSEDRVFLTWLDAFRVFLAQWSEHGGREEDLLRGAALSQAEEWSGKRREALNDNERAFIDASIDYRDRLAREEKERLARELKGQQLARRRRSIAIGSTVIAISAVLAVVILGVLGWRLNEANLEALGATAQALAESERAEEALKDTAQALNLAEEERRRADQAAVQAAIEREKALVIQSRFLADLSRQMTVEGDAVTGMLLALEALPDTSVPRQRPYVVEAERALYSALYQKRELRILRGHESTVNSAAFSPDGTRVVTASGDQTARLWDSETGGEIVVLEGHEGDVMSSAFSPDGARVVTASYDGTARLWDAETGVEVVALKGHKSQVWSAAFSPDGTRVVTASKDKTARLWDAETGAEIVVLEGHEKGVRSAAFSPDGTRVVTASEDGTARLWDAETGVEVVALKGHKSQVWSAAFSPDGTRVVTASKDKTARLWDAGSGAEIAVLEGLENTVESAAFSPDGARLVTASGDGTARLRNAGTGAEIAVLKGHESTVNSAAFSPDGARVVTASKDKTARLWDAGTGTEIAVLEGHGGPVRSAAFSPDGARVVTASEDGTARLWDAGTGALITVLEEHKDRVWSAAFSPDGARVVTASEDGTARLWDAGTGALITVLEEHKDRVWSAAFSPDGTRVVTASSDQTARLWDSETGTEIAVLEGHEGTVNSAAFSPDGARVITASYDQTARLWDSETGTWVAVLEGHGDPVWSAAFSPDGARVVTASYDETARLWDAGTGAEIAVLKGHKKGVRSAAFSPDGARVVTASRDKTARLWDAETGAEIVVLEGHEKGVRSAAFSPDGARVVTASYDGTARLWDAETGVEVVALKGHKSQVWSAAFSPDGTRVVTASDDKTARLWTAFSNTQSLVTYASGTVPRRLTPAQQERFYLSAE